MLKRKIGDKKGANQNPATLFAIITLVVVLYIIIVPPDFRKELLTDDYTSNNGENTPDGYDEVFLEKNPGYWSYNSFDSMDYDLLSFNLLERTNAQNMASSKNLYSKKTAFSNKIANFEFNIDDLKNTDNVFVNFKISDSRGKTHLKVNDQIVKEISGNLKEDFSKIDKNVLLQGKNKISFESFDVGFNFWDYNSLDVSELTIFADITDESGLTNSQSFWLTQDEKINLKNANLRYYVDCEQNSVGPVTISLNSNRIFSGIPDCKILNMISNLDPSLLKEGENKIDFEATYGKFIFDTLLLKANFKENIYPTYFFTINDEDYNILQTGLVEINLTFTFVNDDDYKEVEARLNGHKIGVNTRDRVYSVTINPMDIKNGNNVLEIVPKESMTIVKVELRGLFE